MHGKMSFLRGSTSISKIYVTESLFFPHPSLALLAPLQGFDEKIFV